MTLINIENIPKVPRSHVIKRRVVPGGIQFHALVDHNEKRILGVSHWVTTVNSLAAAELNSNQTFFINAGQQCLVPENFDNTRPWRYRWSIPDEKYMLEENIVEYPEDDLYRYLLMTEKFAALDKINFGIQSYRRFFQKDLMFQDLIYEYKAHEVEKYDNYLEQHGKEIDSDSVPFIRDYAEVMCLDLDLAASAVRLQADIFKTRMLDSEMLRLKYAKQMRECQDINAVDVIVREFQKECFVYGKI